MKDIRIKIHSELLQQLLPAMFFIVGFSALVEK